MEDSLKFEALKTMKIDLSDTAICQLEQRKKGDDILTVKNVNCDERESLKNALMVMDDGND